MGRGEITIDDQIGIALDPVSDLINDESVTDIFIYGKDKVFVKKQGKKLKRVNRGWQKKIDLLVACNTIAQRMKRKLNENFPILDARLNDGSRVNIIIDPLYEDGACLSLRKFPRNRFGSDDLIKFGTIDKSGITILKTLVKLGKKIIISGGTGTGKTTLLNILCSFINEQDIVVTIEDSKELRLLHEFWAPLEARKAFYKEETEVSLRDLVKNALRMNPRWIILGEVRSGEVFDLMRAFNSGHSGMSSLHANSCEDALFALENMFLQGKEMRIEAVRQIISRAVDVVVQIERSHDEKIRVTDISEVCGLEYEKEIPEYKMNKLYGFSLEKFSDQGESVGSFRLFDTPGFIKNIKNIPGIDLPEFWLK
ncbi:MAG: ATPase, T2SS/T4P/T4SS family [Acidobacteriota bacterium]